MAEEPFSDLQEMVLISLGSSGCQLLTADGRDSSSSHVKKYSQSPRENKRMDSIGPLLENLSYTAHT